MPARIVVYLPPFKTSPKFMKYIISLLLALSLCGCDYHTAVQKLNYLQAKFPDAKVFMVPQGETNEGYILTYPCGRVIYINIDGYTMKFSQVEVSPCNKPL